MAWKPKNVSLNPIQVNSFSYFKTFHKASEKMKTEEQIARQEEEKLQKLEVSSVYEKEFKICLLLIAVCAKKNIQEMFV